MQILNNDGTHHNVHTFCTKNPLVNLLHPQSKKKLMMRFAAPERVSVRCDIHGWMHSWIIAVDHPYHAVTNTEGEFTTIGVPTLSVPLETVKVGGIHRNAKTMRSTAQQHSQTNGNS